MKKTSLENQQHELNCSSSVSSLSTTDQQKIIIKTEGVVLKTIRQASLPVSPSRGIADITQWSILDWDPWRVL
jgi:hypothetical protein